MSCGWAADGGTESLHCLALSPLSCAAAHDLPVRTWAKNGRLKRLMMRSVIERPPPLPPPKAAEAPPAHPGLPRSAGVEGMDGVESMLEVGVQGELLTGPLQPAVFSLRRA